MLHVSGVEREGNTIKVCKVLYLKHGSSQGKNMAWTVSFVPNVLGSQPSKAMNWPSNKLCRLRKVESHSRARGLIISRSWLAGSRHNPKPSICFYSHDLDPKLHNALTLYNLLLLAGEYCDSCGMPLRHPPETFSGNGSKKSRNRCTCVWRFFKKLLHGRFTNRAIAVFVGRVAIWSFQVFEFSFVPEVSV